MKRLILVLAALGASTGCIVPRHVVVAPVPPPVVVEHVHGPGCGHYWGDYSGYPVYYYGDTYSYYDGRAWVRMNEPPHVYYQHHPEYVQRGGGTVYYNAPPAHAATPVYSTPPAHNSAPMYHAAPPPPAGHAATPVYQQQPPPPQHHDNGRRDHGEGHGHEAVPARP